jgi:hypothetical protein
MSKFGLIVAATLTASLSGACERTTCDKQQILRVVDKDIKEDGRRPNEYQLAEMKREGSMMYVGMGQNISPTYRRHYLIDPQTCKILDVNIDQ